MRILQLKCLADEIVGQARIEECADATFEGLFVKVNHEMIPMSLNPRAIDREDIGDLDKSVVLCKQRFIPRDEEVELRMRVDLVPAGLRLIVSV